MTKNDVLNIVLREKMFSKKNHADYENENHSASIKKSNCSSISFRQLKK